MAISGNSKHFLFKKTKQKIAPYWEGGGGPNPHAKFQNPRTIPSGRKVTGGEKKKGERKKTINSGHYVLPATPKGSARNSLVPKI